MNKVISQDDTAIAYDQVGQGPAVILVGGAFNSRSFGPNGPLVNLLAQRFTVINYDRRGRGDSGDTAPYAVEREIEDIAALIDAVGGSASVYGISSGAALALEAANHGLPIEKLALYEAPFIVDNSRRPIPSDYLGRLQKLIAEERRGAAIKLFMTQGVGMPAIFVAMMQLMPAWRQLKEVAHTIVYDATALGDTGEGKPLPKDRWTSVTMPTLVICGGKSPTWMKHAMQALPGVLPNAQYRTLEGEMHIVKAEAIAPVLTEFFAS